MNTKIVPAFLICLGMFFTACQESKSGLTPDIEARNVYINTSLIKVSVVMKMMASFSKSIVKSVSDTSKITDKNEGKFEAEFATVIDSIMPLLAGKFDSLKQATPKKYNELFNGPVLQEGVKMANVSVWFDGLPRLTQPLSQKEIQAYVDRITASMDKMKGMKKGDDIQDPFAKKAVEFAKWSAQADSLVEVFIPVKKKYIDVVAKPGAEKGDAVAASGQGEDKTDLKKKERKDKKGKKNKEKSSY